MDSLKTDILLIIVTLGLQTFDRYQMPVQLLWIVSKLTFCFFAFHIRRLFIRTRERSYSQCWRKGSNRKNFLSSLVIIRSPFKLRSSWITRNVEVRWVISSQLTITVQWLAFQLHIEDMPGLRFCVVFRSLSMLSG